MLIFDIFEPWLLYYVMKYCKVRARQFYFNNSRIEGEFLVSNVCFRSPMASAAVRSKKVSLFGFATILLRKRDQAPRL